MKNKIFALLLCTAMIILASCQSSPPIIGEQGEQGIPGEKGDIGADGVSVVESYIDENRHLILKMSDGSEIDAGYIDNICKHSLEADAAVPATCTESGKTEGSHCTFCGVTIVPQLPVAATGHSYNSGAVLTEATCDRDGTKRYTCINPRCSHSYTDSYSLSSYTANEIYSDALEYVGEITVFDRNGVKLGLGTGIAYSSDGKIITNYHVISDAHSASISIDDVPYPITSVLAYDENIDLAILKINATGLSSATICKKASPVGSTVYAIGSSRGMTNTFSQGIVTYSDRVVDGVSHVQHDASLANGNSGGPLINEYGEVIGFNTWCIADSQNLNFAVAAAELDNLRYGTPMTLAEVYAQNHTDYDILVDYICRYGTYNAIYQWYEIDYTLEKTDYSDHYSLVYDTSDGSIWIATGRYHNDEWSVFVDMMVDFDPDSMYYAASYTDNGVKSNGTQGTLVPSSFTSSTSAIPYTEFKGSDESKDTILSMYCESISAALTWLDYLFETDGVGLTLADLGFTDYVVPTT